jgi:hypothetical protein
MENSKRFTQRLRRGGGADPPIHGAATFDGALAIIWRVLRDFPEARLALQTALREVLVQEDSDGTE